ncbi:hypothetical protein BDW22DRAFT_1438351 [Trametopsis cervina]|nr:hypothetical protein BDW22DRAFT_1438351 [Trametopsis cervina]
MIRGSDLQGFRVPGVADKIIISLFADDTTTYLSEHDDPAALDTILAEWCAASGGKFNTDKTEIVPIGTPTYRAAVVQQRAINAHADPFPPHTRLTPDGAAIRLLGAWIGNDADTSTPWMAVLDKVSAALYRWGRCRPTLRGKRLIVQMIVAGMTQYLAKAQGMPLHIEQLLVQKIRRFLWDDAKRPPVGLDTLYLPIEEGGIKLLDIHTRNDAIELTWIQSYLSLTQTRPVWAYLADELISKTLTSRANSHARMVPRRGHSPPYPRPELHHGALPTTEPPREDNRRPRPRCSTPN